MFAVIFTDGSHVFSTDASGCGCMADAQDKISEKLGVGYHAVRNIAWSTVGMFDAMDKIPKKWKKHSVLPVVIN